jgi:PPOX class probable F420-dependent enzyme
VDAAEARDRFTAERVARLATAGADGRPHVVPIGFAVLGGARIVSVVDHKPKRTPALRRLANIEANPQVAVLADRWSENWSELWWVRADGLARVLAPGDALKLRAQALRSLASKYPQYAERLPAGALVAIDVQRWSGWSAA